MNQQVKTWIEYCEGNPSVDQSAIETLFMASLSETDLDLIFGVFPNSSDFRTAFDSTYDDKCVQIADSERSSRAKKLALESVRHLSTSVNACGYGTFDELPSNTTVDLTDDLNSFARRANDSEHSVDFVQAVCDLVDSNISRDRKSIAYYSACYFIDNDLLLQAALAVPIFPESKIEFRDLMQGLESYLRLWALGGSYAWLGESVLIFLSEKCPMHPFWIKSE